ncbi:MAG TPA: type 1 glutamine amidotransferase domain-containing protein [Burkholderiaceae bacterium]|jgi:protease I|nr:type 1 glutamine amidotransferase domain-containing protein [Burkholderiaceae bacterium]
MRLKNIHVAMLVENLYQEMEIWVPVFRLQEEGAQVTFIGPKADAYKSKLGYPVQADLAARDAVGKHFDAVIVPGGYAPDLMRTDASLVQIVRDHCQSGAIVAAICHGTWMLASAGALPGKRVTGAAQIRDDIVHAGATFVDEPAVRDGNLITSRKPADLPQFCAAIVSALAEKHA